MRANNELQISNKKTMFKNFKKLGILGGGQLGKMVALEAGNWHFPIHFLDTKSDFPAGRFAATFTEGNFKNYDDVYNFGKEMDVITIEIEHVNTEALLQLQKEGKTIHPAPEKLVIIKDKGLQKQFYDDHNLPTSPFQLLDNEEVIIEKIKARELSFPFVQKSRSDGYDGKGVAVIRSEKDLEKLLPGASLIEELVDIEKELAVIVARNESGEIVAYPPVEMEFNPVANLVEFLLCPAQITEEHSQLATDLAKAVIEKLDICGLLAVELFLTKKGEILINEVAPRPHNSGHHTIDSCLTSQFEQHIRSVMDLPLGSTKMTSPSIMINLLGADGFTGPAYYEGFEDCLKVEGANLHFYGKEITKPFRKMGHATIVDSEIDSARKKAKSVQEKLIIRTK